MTRLAWCMAVLCLLCRTGAAGPERKDGRDTVSFSWSPADVADCRRGETVGPAAKDGVSLVDQDVLRHEIGRSVHVDSRAAWEEVGGPIQVRKQFVLKSPKTEGAELCVMTSGRMDACINGRDVPPYERVHLRSRPYNGVYPADKFPEGHTMHHLNGKPYKEYWQGGWERIPFDPSWLQEGTNTFVLSASEGKRLRLLIEPSLYPDRSAVSRDGGRTWDSDHLSTARNINGEYLIRLCLQRHPAHGWVESEPVDLWPHDPAPIARAARVSQINIEATAEVPGGTALRIMARVGPSPVYAPESWTAWQTPEALQQAVKTGALPAGCRFLQWRVRMTASADRSQSPCLSGMRVRVGVRPLSAGTAPRHACTLKQRPIVRCSHPFAHARKSTKLQVLRDRAGLDEVVKGKERGIEQLLALAKFTRKMFGSNDRGALKTDTPWNALLLWQTARKDDRQTSAMCTHRGSFFVQCATALGYPARPCIWSHAIAEAWVDGLGSWVAFDPSGGFYFEIDGKPAGMLEVSLVWDGTREGKPPREVRRVWGKNKSGTEKNKGLAWFSRFWMPMRSNYQDSTEPYEPGHGRSSFKYDGYLRWLHPHKKPLPWFRFTSSRPGDFAFTVNTVNLHFAHGETPQDLAVTVEDSGPNTDRIEARRDAGEWEEVQPEFTWRLHDGRNALQVRSVNTFGVPAVPAQAEVTVR